MALCDRRFGAELQRRRLEHSLSLGALALRLHYSKSYLSRIESGDRRPSTDLARRCDDALGARGSLACLVQGRQAAPTGVERTDGLPEAADIASHPVHSVASSQSLAMLATDEGTLAGFRAALTLLRRLGRISSPGFVLPQVVAHLSAMRVLIGATTGARQAGYLLVAAELSEFAGWMAEESGDSGQADGWTLRAAEYADAVGDVDLPAHALVRRANAAMYRGDGRQTVDLAEGAQRTAGVSHRVRGMAALREAQGRALLGDTSGCMRALDRARNLLADPAVAPSALGLHSVGDPCGLVHGWCLYDLGEPERAAEVLAAEVRTVPERARRTRSRFGVRLAVAQAASGDVEQAVRTTTAALCDALLVDSMTIRTDVGHLARELSRWRHRAVVHEISPLVRDVLSRDGGHR